MATFRRGQLNFLSVQASPLHRFIGPVSSFEEIIQHSGYTEDDYGESDQYTRLLTVNDG